MHPWRRARDRARWPGMGAAVKKDATDYALEVMIWTLVALSVVIVAGGAYAFVRFVVSL